MSRKTLLNGILVVVALGLGAYLAREPWQVYRVQNVRAKQAISEMQRAEASHAELAAARARAESPTGREAMVRERGYVKPGERSIVEHP